MLDPLSDPARLPPADDDRALRRLVALFADAAVHADADAFAAVWADDGRWTIAAPIDAAFDGRAAIRDGFAGLMARWEFLVQAPQYGLLDVAGDAATGRWLVREVGRSAGGAGQQNYGLYDDRYVRTAEGWRFASRRYSFLLLDDGVVAGNYASPVGAA